MIQAVLFDMDGTLFDTEAIYAEGWYKGGVPHELYLQLIGRSAVDQRETLTKAGFDFDAVLRCMHEYAAQVLAKEVPVKPGAKEALMWLKEHGIKAAIATSSLKETAEKYLVQTGLTDYIDAVVSGFELEHGKPAPDIFLMAAKEVGAAPESCVVVEDAISGVHAGKSAGMLTVMVPDRIAPDEETRRIADGILDTLHELPDWLAARL